MQFVSPMVVNIFRMAVMERSSLFLKPLAIKLKMIEATHILK